jgi:hypothetical protein
LSRAAPALIIARASSAELNCICRRIVPVE